jgi:hypothetical protein
VNAAGDVRVKAAVICYSHCITLAAALTPTAEEGPAAPSWARWTGSSAGLAVIGKRRRENAAEQVAIVDPCWL